MGLIYSLLGWDAPGDPDPVTGLTPKDNKLIQSSWRTVVEQPLEAGKAIMLSLFEKHPQYKQMFPFRDVPMDELKDNVRFHVHCNTVVYMFTQIVDNLDSTEMVIALLDKVATNHVRHGATKQSFHDIQGIIVDVLATKVTPEALEVWKKLLDVAMPYMGKQLT